MKISETIDIIMSIVDEKYYNLENRKLESQLTVKTKNFIKILIIFYCLKIYRLHICKRFC